MIEMPKRIWAKAEMLYDGIVIGRFADTVRYLPEGTEYVRADLPPKVKPLEWVRTEHRQPDQIAYHAQSISVPYAIWTNKAHRSFIVSSGGYFSKVTDTLEAAQEAAQADHEARILAALVQP